MNKLYLTFSIAAILLTGLSFNPGHRTHKQNPDEPASRSSFTFPDYRTLAEGSQKLSLLPGRKEFTFTMYGVPRDPEKLKELVKVMVDNELGNGFDPGPEPWPVAKSIYQYLGRIGWPVVCYPGCSDMQVKGGRCIMGPENAAVLAPMDSAGAFTALQLGEWGYYFHNLSTNERWWHDVFGPDFDQYRHLMKPRGLYGYDKLPAAKKECYEVVKDYYLSRQKDLLGRVISVTGHSHYEAYAGEWGARCIGLEVGENIAFTQSKFAFARGAARQWQKPWSVQMSPWFSGTCTTSGPLHREGGVLRGLDAGHSLSLYERMWLHGWFAGAAMVTPENSIAIFFEKPESPWTLTEHGLKAAEIFRFMKSHDRGIPYTPVAIVIDHLAGYNGYMGKPWGILQPSPGDLQISDLLEEQIFPGSDHIHKPRNSADPESSYLRPTPFGEIFDVQLTNASVETLTGYPVLLLAGDIDFDAALIDKMEKLLKKGTRILLSENHKMGLGTHFSPFEKYRGLEILKPWINPMTNRPAAISATRLKQLADEILPVEISGDPVQSQVNRTATGWVIELVNNQGVIKKPDQPAQVNPAAVAKTVLRPKIKCLSAKEWRSGKEFKIPGEILIEVGPGQTAFVEIHCSKSQSYIK